MPATASKVARTITRKRPFRARKRVPSARANIQRDQHLTYPSPQLNPFFPKKEKRAPPRGNPNPPRHGKYSREVREFRALLRDFIRELRRATAAANAIPVRHLRLTEYVQDGVVTRCKVVTRVREDFCAKSAYKAAEPASRTKHAHLSRAHRRVQIRPQRASGDRPAPRPARLRGPDAGPARRHPDQRGQVLRAGAAADQPVRRRGRRAFRERRGAPAEGIQG